MKNNIFKKPAALELLLFLILFPYKILSFFGILFLSSVVTLSAFFVSFFKSTIKWIRPDTPDQKELIQNRENLKIKNSPVFLHDTIDAAAALYKYRPLWLIPPGLIIIATILIYSTFSDFKSISQFIYTLDSAIIMEERAAGNLPD
jgi:hypothetical protein